jgi:putative acetyltransferase
MTVDEATSDDGAPGAATPEDVTVRDPTPDDARAVGEVHQRAILELGRRAYTAEQVAAWSGDREADDYELDLEGRRFVVAERAVEPDERTVVGFGSLEPEPESEFADPVAVEVTGVYVHPDHAREGVGSALLADLEAQARAWNADHVWLMASLNAVSFYEAKGYERVREHDHEFHGEATGTVVEMRREL